MPTTHPFHLVALAARFAPALLATVILAGCPPKAPTSNDNRGAGANTPSGHHHTAHHPNSALVALGDHFAHVEVALDAATGRITAYFADGENEHPVMVAHESIELKIESINDKPAEVSVTLKAVADVKTGEKVGATSQFEGQADALKGAKEFDGEIGPFTVKGVAVKATDFNWPKGNEGDHDHDHDHEHGSADNKANSK